jgi:hypothetical protein
MKTAFVRILAVPLLAGLFTACGTSQPASVDAGSDAQPPTGPMGPPGGGRGRGPGAGNGPGNGPMQGHPNLGCTFERGSLPDSVVVGVREAIADEWKAEAQYDAFSSRFGPPFPRLERAEGRHADLLAQLLGAHGHEAGSRSNADPANVATAQGACAAALETERANVSMYDRLLAAGPPADVRCVYEHLRSISAERHIPALERCGGGRP